MKREDLAHILRAASKIVDDPDVVIIGSQSILGSYDEDDLPAEAVGSVEADVAFWDDEANDKSDMVDMHLGEESHFHVTNGYYAQGVSITTAKLPEGYRERMVRWENHSSQPGRAWCLEPHDLAASKLAAWREKDREFVGALIDFGLIKCAVLRERIETLPVLPTLRRRLLKWIDTVEATPPSADGR